MDRMIPMTIARAVVISSLTAALAACADRGMSASDRALADARADSSAAGYETGLSSQTETVHADSVPTTSPSDSLRRVSAGAHATAISRSKSAPSNPGQVTKAPTKLAAASKTSPSAAAPRPPRKGATSAATPERPVIVNDFLSYDPTTRIATLRVAAGTISSGDGLDFNGTKAGAAIVTIPVGWHVSVAFQNSDDELPHSAVVIDDIEPIPQDLPDPAFPGAATPQASEGTPEESNDQMSFTASRLGRFLIACGVPGHAQGGQWMVLLVSPNATVPAYHP
jgi:Sulfocyanin (SoxE) domain